MRQRVHLLPQILQLSVDIFINVVKISLQDMLWLVAEFEIYIINFLLELSLHLVERFIVNLRLITVATNHVCWELPELPL